MKKHLRIAKILLAVLLLAAMLCPLIFITAEPTTTAPAPTAPSAMRFIPACPPCGISQRGWGPLPIMDWARCSCCSALCCLFPCRTGVPVPYCTEIRLNN